jgi:hypothetical protein
VILKEKSIRIWKHKLDWIVSKGGMALINTHPDYMNFDNSPSSIEEYPVNYYIEFLKHTKENYDGQYWNVLPRDISRFWKSAVKS